MPTPVLTVTELNAEIHFQLNNQFPSVFVHGEITGLYQPKSGHLYFSLKDAESQIRAVIWKSELSRIFRDSSFELRDGIEVICGGSISVFPARGEYQLNVRKMQPFGEGPRELALRQLKEKLNQEGLFDPARKRMLPKFPRYIAVITSPSGAAIRDFLHVLQPRWPNVEVLLMPVRVQGEGATAQITYALKAISRLRRKPDVVVLTRGGGSVEDLWSFNEESVCRAISGCPVPVICGVGHEVDVTLADFVADVRALTPSDAALKLVPSQLEIRGQLQRLQQRMVARLESIYQNAFQKLEGLAQRRVLTAPMERIHQWEMELDRLQLELNRSTSQHLKQLQHQLQALAARLDSINPVSVLARGYSLTTKSDNQLVTDTRQIRIGEQLTTQLAKGQVISRVERTSNEPEQNTTGQKRATPPR